MKKDEVAEILALLFLCFVQLWWLEKPIVVPFIFLIALVSFLVREDNWQNFGLGNINKSLATLSMFVFIYWFKKIETFSGGQADLSYIPEKVAQGYFWALGQQIILNSYLTNRLYSLTNKKYLLTILTAGTIFSLAHLPNLFLTLATWPGGVIMSAIFIKRKNLYELALLHLIVSTILYLLVSPEIYHHFVVGYRFYK
jgi:hypothetical protein